MRTAPALALALLPAAAHAQSLTYTSRTGQNTVYCGAPGAGPLVQHNFSTPAATDDSASVSDPGGPNLAPSHALARLLATPAASGLRLSFSGTAGRGTPGGAYATGDARDIWTFTLDLPTPFTLDAALHLASSDGSAGIQGYTFTSSTPGLITLDPGTPPDALSLGILAPGDSTRHASGTLRPGSYYLSLFGRTEGSSFPWAGEFAHAVTLTLGPGCPADVNADGFLDFFDYDDFVACFESGVCGPVNPDFNRDGFIDFFDYDDFVAAFEAGC